MNAKAFGCSPHWARTHHYAWSSMYLPTGNQSTGVSARPLSWLDRLPLLACAFCGSGWCNVRCSNELVTPNISGIRMPKVENELVLLLWELWSSLHFLVKICLGHKNWWALHQTLRGRYIQVSSNRTSITVATRLQTWMSSMWMVPPKCWRL